MSENTTLGSEDRSRANELLFIGVMRQEINGGLFGFAAPRVGHSAERYDV
jgi:hypothetical protein